MYGSISIHASAKEATLRLRKAGSHRGHFNPRLREGGDPFYRWSRPQNQHFNPRLREGGDEGFLSLNDYICISIHASAKEATTESALSAVVLTISIHASAKEATSFVVFDYYTDFISIHASAKEATATYCDTSAIMYISSLNNFFVHYF